MNVDWKNWGIILGTTWVSILLIWMPFFMQLGSFWTIPLPSGGMQTVMSNFDGPYYLVVVRSWYESEAIKRFEFDEPVEYYAAHFPGYPLVIALFDMFMDLPWAMLMATCVFAGAAGVMFYELAKLVGVKQPLWLAMVFVFLPFRWLELKSVGSPEPQFLFLTLLAIWGFLQRKYWITGLAGGLAVLTKSPGILLFGAIGLTVLVDLVKQSVTTKRFSFWREIPWRAYPVAMIPMSLVGLWVFYGYVYGSFWAYFESGDNLHLFWPPLQMFNREAYWVGDFWLEEILWIFLFVGGGLSILWKRKDLLTWYSLVFLVSILFVSHRDIARYSLPLMPMMLIAYAPWLSSQRAKIVLTLMIVPIYLFTINYIAGNVVPISDWSRLL